MAVDGESFRISVSEFDPRQKPLGQLVDVMLKLNTMVTLYQLDLAQGSISPDSEIKYHGAKRALQRCYDELNRREREDYRA